MFIKMVLNTEAAKVVKQRLIGGKAKMLLLSSVYFINAQNILKGSPEELGEKMGMTRRDFVQGIRELKEMGLVRKYTKQEYMINPDIFYAGDEKKYFVLKHMWATQTSRGLRK